MGESFIKTISAGAGTPFSWNAAIFSFFGIAVVFGLWWLYFDDTEAAEIKPTFAAPYVWIYSHLPLALGLTAFGVAAKKLFVGVEEAYVKYDYLVLFCVAIIFYAVALALIDRVTERHDELLANATRFYWRLIMAAAFGVLALLGEGLSPIEFIVIAALIFAVEVAGGLRRQQLAIAGPR